MTFSPPETQKQLRLLKAREAAEYLRISLSTLHRIEKRGLLTPLRTPGGHRRYSLQMLNDCLTRPAASASKPKEDSGGLPA